MSSSPVFVHLRVRSALSLLQSTISPDALARWAVEQKAPAIGVTDDNTMFGALEISEKLAAVGCQPITGLGLGLYASGVSGGVALFACDHAGYVNLLHLSSESFARQQKDGVAGVELEVLLAHQQGLICLSGGDSGLSSVYIGAGNPQMARDHLRILRDSFGDRLYVELQRHGVGAAYESELIEAAYDLSLPLVATHDARFVHPEGKDSQHVLMCIGAGKAQTDPDSPQVDSSQYLKPAVEMERLFHDLPEALSNSVEIARRCAYRPHPRGAALPAFLQDSSEEGEELSSKAREGLERRFAMGSLYGSEQKYRQRLGYELGVIQEMGFAGYFLIVSDFVVWALDRGIPVGPGRGSGAGSLVAYALRITDLDPLRFGLLFERFLNPDRVSIPDFDIDFCQERRGEVIDYVQKKYGIERVAHIITFGTLQARAVLRDVGRVMQMPFGRVDRLAKMVPFIPAHPSDLRETLDNPDSGLGAACREDREVSRLLEVALDLEGLHRNASTHAAGIVVADRPIRELVPLYKDPKSGVFATQFSMKWAEEAGLVKFDFLGLKTLTVLERARILALEEGEDWDQGYYSLEAAEAYELLSSGYGLGVFQMESAGMRETLRKVRPDRIEDVIALISLYRPGPMKNIDRFVMCKRGEEEPDYLHPDLRPVLEETYGVIVYQEQVMQIARILASYSLAEADLLRRAMGKKRPEEMAQQKTRFLSGAVKKGVSKKRAEAIFDLVAEFAGYGFNKSHAAAYAVISYRTAWVKAHYPASFLAASMSLDRHNTDRLEVLAAEARRLGVGILSPDINHSGADFLVEGNSVRYALSAIKGIGRGAMEGLEKERLRAKFSSLSDFAERMNSSILGKRGFETLAAAGAFGSVESNRARIHEAAGRLAALSASEQAARESGQAGLFSESVKMADISLPSVPEWEESEKFRREHAAIGYYLSGHPLESEFEYHTGVKAGEVEALPFSGQSFCMIGLVGSFRQRRSRSDKKFGLASLSDPSGSYEVLIPPEHLENTHELFSDGARLRCWLRKRQRHEGMGLVLEKALPLCSGKQAKATPVPVQICLRAEEGVSLQPLAEMLTNISGKDGSACKLHLALALEEGREVVMDIGRHSLHPSDITELKSLSGFRMDKVI